MGRGSKTKRVAIYLRVSTSEQTTGNQRHELEAVAARHGWNVVEVYEDAGISGAKGRDQRPGLDALLKAVARREVDMVAAWSIDRLGRSLQDLLSFLGELHAKGCDLYLHVQGLDTSTPSGRAMFQMMGVFAEFERAMIQERVKAGLARAKASKRRVRGKARRQSVGRKRTPRSKRRSERRKRQSPKSGSSSLRRGSVSASASFSVSWQRDRGRSNDDLVNHLLRPLRRRRRSCRLARGQRPDLLSQWGKLRDPSPQPTWRAGRARSPAPPCRLCDR